MDAERGCCSLEEAVLLQQETSLPPTLLQPRTGTSPSHPPLSMQPTPASTPGLQASRGKVGAGEGPAFDPFPSHSLELTLSVTLKGP